MSSNETVKHATLGSAGLDRAGCVVFLDNAFAELLGREREGLVGQHFTALVSAADPAAHHDRFAALAAGRVGAFQLEGTHRTAAGELRAARLLVCRAPEAGAVAATLIVEGLTDRHRAEQRLAAQHAVARILAEAETIAEASPRILQAICESLGFDVGGLWIVDESTERLRAVEGWVAPGIHAPEFMAATQNMRPGLGVGLPGTAWHRGEPVWIEDLPSSGPIFVRGPLAAKEGLHGAFAFPIVLGAEVLGVVDFFSREVRRPDHDVLQMLSTFGSQIGQFMERKRIEEALRASEHQLQAITDNTPSYIYVTDLEDRVLLFNKRTEAMFGMSSRDARGKKLGEILSPALRDMLAAQRAQGGGRLLEREEVVMRDDGPHTYLTHRFVICGQDGRPYAVCGISTDITATKRAEDDLRALAAELGAAEDRERKRLAVDLHDSIGQNLSALKIALERAAAAGSAFAGQAGALELVDKVIGDIRTMTFDLYPVMLEDLGLVATVHSYCEQFTRRTQIRASLQEIGPRGSLPMPVRNYLFRAIKELLNNVAKHSHAQEALVAVHWKRDAVRVVVTDNGCGFDAQQSQEARHRRGIGLADIRERVRVMGGHISIDSSPAGGAQVVLEVPMKEAAHG